MAASAAPLSSTTRDNTKTLGAETADGGALDRLLEVTADDMGRVNALILERANSHVEMVPELARYLIEAGGKRLRPMLTVAAASLFGKQNGSEIRFAAAVEFMHNATLLHDDVVDESDMRRGRPAARVIWGNQASVLVGDFLLGQAFMMMVETGDIEALGVLAKAAAIIAEGEVFQLAKAGDLSATPEDYAQVIRAKTATLFEAACEVGAMAGGANEAGRAALRHYGRELGCAFQLVDDVLDYRGESGTLGKNVGDDLREGKMTLPVILALAEGNPAEREIVGSALGNPETPDGVLAQVVAILNRHNTLTRTLAMAQDHAEKAKAALASANDGPMKTLLGEIADFTVARAY
jgi:octaprenyl-diphosphate synthase